MSKTVSGEGADQEKAFSFTVTLGDKTVNGTYGDMEFKNGVATFTLKHSEKKTAEKLPETTYEVVETDCDGYTVTVNGDAVADATVSGTLVNGKTIALAFNNAIPEDPENPDKPDDPVEPQNPDTPATPDKPDAPEQPDKPSTPSKPGAPATSSTPTLPKAGQLWWPVMLLFAAGLLTLANGSRRRKTQNAEKQNDR